MRRRREIERVRVRVRVRGCRVQAKGRRVRQAEDNVEMAGQKEQSKKGGARRAGQVA
jgi:hypothetical protein